MTTLHTLWEQALALVRGPAGGPDGVPRDELEDLLRQLQSQQIELERQNAALRREHTATVESRDHFLDLFESAPAGYLTTDREGRVVEANQAVAHLLGVEREQLRQAPFPDFVLPDSQSLWTSHTHQAWGDGIRRSCELSLRGAAARPILVRIDSVMAGDGSGRRLRSTICDLSEAQQVSRGHEPIEQRYRQLALSETDFFYRLRLTDGPDLETPLGVQCEALTGYSPEEFARHPKLWTEIIVSEDRSLVADQLASLMASRPSPPIQYRIRRRDGAVRWVQNSVAPVRDRDGRLMACDGLIQDVTRSRSADDALHQLNTTLEQRVDDQTRAIQLLAKSLQNLGEGVLITGDELEWPGPRIVFVNEALCRMTGYSSAELIGHAPRILHGERTDRKTLADMMHHLAVGHSARGELRFYRKDGSSFDDEIFISPLFDDAGRRTHFVAIHRDITERKLAQQQLRERQVRLQAILDAATSAIVTFDERGIITSINRATEEMFGYSEGELLESRVSQLMPSPYREELEQGLLRHPQAGRDRITGNRREVAAIRRDQSLFPIELSISTVDHLKLFTAIMVDISERKRLQQHLLEISAQEQRRIGQELHDGTGQELTGLTLIATAVRNLLDTLPAPTNGEPEARQLPEPLFQRLRGMTAGLCERLAESNRNIRQLSHGIMPVQVDAEGLRSALSELAGGITAGGTATCRLDCRFPVRVANNLVATHLYRIAQEAVNNALRHGQATEIRLVLDQRADQIVLQVIDNGVGMTLPSGPRGNHAGLGLQTMEYRAGILGGTLQIDSEPGSGTTVTCSVMNGGRGFNE